MQIINENYKKFPIKFYKTEKGVYFENSFIRGEAKDLTDAFNQLKDKLDDYELFYYYDDISDSKVGAFVPALKDTKTKRGIYLGKLEISLDIDKEWANGEQTVTYHPEKISDHEKWITKMKNAKKRDEFFQKLKDGIKKIATYFQHEYFDPYKTREDLICEYCGEIIPQGSYYEEWHKKNYHLECIWDMFCNGTKHNEHEKATTFFLGLNDVEWDFSKQCKDDYDSDLELYKSNKRRGLCESAAMYRSPLKTFEEFYNQILENPKATNKRYFSLFNDTLRVASDVVIHDWNKHKTTYKEWKDCLSNLKNIQNACLSKKKIQGRKTYLCRILGFKDYGLTLVEEPKYFYVTTCFVDNPNSIDNWIETGMAQRLTNNPSASLSSEDELSVAHVESKPIDIINYIKEKIKCY